MLAKLSILALALAAALPAHADPITDFKNGTSLYLRTATVSINSESGRSVDAVLIAKSAGSLDLTFKASDLGLPVPVTVRARGVVSHAHRVHDRRHVHAAHRARRRPVLPVLQLTQTQRDELVTKGTTCPFARVAIALNQVRLHGDLTQPVANTGDIARLGNVGGGDLGKVLRFFAAINHNKLVGPGGATKQAVPEGTFGAWFPGSKGAHPGHSGILMGDPSNVGSGRFSPEKLDRLSSAFSTLYPDGKRYISREQIGAFIAENVKADPKSRGFNREGIKTLSIEVAKLLARAAIGGDAKLLEDTAHLLVTNNDLMNSSGEFALLFARFADGQDADGNPLVSTAAIDSLFRQGVFPVGWDKRPAFAKQWIKDTLVITKASVFASWGF